MNLQRVIFKGNIHFAVTFSFLGMIVTGIILSSGVYMTPDGWAYWEGSVSILNGNGYTYFGGQKISDFPPLFSLLLAFQQCLTGVSGLSISIYLTLISGATIFSWIYILLFFLNDKGLILRLVLSLYVVSFITYSFTTLLSDTLSLFLLACSLIGIIKLSKIKEQLGYSIYIFLAMLFLLLLLTKNSNIVFIPGFFLSIFLLISGGFKKRLITCLLVIGLPLFLWVLVRYIFEQIGSHPLTFSGKFSLIEYIIHFIFGISNFFAPSIVGYLLLISSIATLMREFILNFSVSIYRTSFFNVNLIVFSGIFFLFILFNLTWIDSEFSGRFLWILPLMIVGAFCFILSYCKKNVVRRIVIFIVCLIVLVQFLRTVKLVMSSYSSSHRVSVLLSDTIMPNYHTGPPIILGDLTLISPPEFHWVNRHNTINKVD